MKNHIYALLIITSAFYMSGCRKFLDQKPDGQLTTEIVFSSRERTEDWLAGIYQSVPNPLWGYYKDQGFSMMGDDMTIPAQWAPFGWGSVYSYMTGNWDATSSWSPNYWIELPRRIRSALVLLRDLKPVPEKNIDATYVEDTKYQARFLIAYYYSLMLEVYGPIPFRPGVIFPNDGSPDELMITQSPYDSVVNWVDAELKEVAAHLPATRAVTDYGKATSVMCLAARSRMWMMAASPLFNGNPDYANIKNKNGVNLFSTSYDAAKWQKAAQACKELIDAAEAGGYQLYYEYYDNGKNDPYMSYHHATIKRYTEGNKEILFERTGDMGDIRWWQGHHLPRGIGGNGGLGVTQELVDAFYMENGLPIEDPASGYVESGFSNGAEHRDTKWKGGLYPREVTIPETYNMYIKREPRFYASVIFNGCWLNVDFRRANFYLNGPDGGPTFDAPQNGYEVRKRIDLEVFPRNGKFVDPPGIIYRLAEAYLSYAEALNDSNPGNPDILKYLNKVRERGGIPNVTGGTQEQLRKIIRRERRIELNCEGQRIHDIRRWKIGEETLNRDMMGMNFNGTERSDDPNNPRAYYVRKINMRRTFLKKMYLWPVPQSQMDMNPNLVQMPGYN